MVIMDCISYSPQIFRDKLAEAKERADEIGTILPIKVKKYRPQRKIKDDLTFD